MLTLDLPVEPYWLDLPRGVRVEIRPVTTAVMAAAQAAAARRLAAIRIADPDLDCESTWKKAPPERGDRRPKGTPLVNGFNLALGDAGGHDWDAGGGDDREDPSAA
jgi:hypothetical protein